MIAADVRPLIVQRDLRLMRAELANLDEIAKALDKQSIQTRMAAIYWGMKRHTDEFSWGKEGMCVRHISLDQVAQCSNLEELDELSTIDTMSLKCPNKHSRE